MRSLPVAALILASGLTAAPSLPSLAASGLPGDVNVQLDTGLDEVESLLGVRPDPSVVRPPGSSIDEPTLRSEEHTSELQSH